ncbi:MAG: DNA alkylation repair protein [Actinomycetota bacterium]
MADALKDSFGPDIPVRIARMITPVYPAFDPEAFLVEALAGYEQLELTPRAHRIAEVMAHHLPADFEEAAPILLASLGPPIEGDELIGQGMALFLYLPHVFFVARWGAGHWETAMAVQRVLTQRMSCEYSIRVFLESEPERTLARLREWATDPNPHVRRLVSEGTRPRLPWAPRLRRFQEDPTSVIDLLELLKDDPSTMVRRSVANNLNDIGKDHPVLLVEVCGRWLDGADSERVALVRHALRSAVKRGEAGALALLGFGDPSGVAVTTVTVDPPVVRIGEKLKVAFSIANRGRKPATYNVDLKVHFVKANGTAGPKVFKVAQLELGPGESAPLSKSISLAQHTTRTHFPGEHRLEVVVNGKGHPLGSAEVVEV